MVQIVNVDPKPSVWAAIGQGLGSGISEGAKSGLSYKLQDMYDQKKSSRKIQEEGSKGLAILKMLKPDATEQEMAAAYALGGENTFKMLDMMGESGFAQFAASGGATQEVQPQQSPTQQDVLGRSPTQNINIQGLPERQPQPSPQQMQQTELPQQQQFVEPSQPRPPFMAMQSETAAPQHQESTQRFPQAALRRAADMSDQEFKQWLDSKKIAPKWQVKYQQERRKQQEMDLKQREDIRKSRKEAREEERFAREMEQTPSDLKPYVEDIESKRASTSGRDNSINLAEQAVRSGNVSGVTQFLAERWGIDPLKSENTALLNAAAKEFTLSNIRRAGSRPNQWIEQQIREMFPKAGKSDVANMMSLEALKLENDINKKEVEIYDKLSEEDYARQGRLGRDIRRRVDNELKPYIESRSNLASIKMQEIRESKKSFDDLKLLDKVAPGTPLTNRRLDALIQRFNGDVDKVAKEAARMGYKMYESGE